jgi:hypothetical protein
MPEKEEPPLVCTSLGASDVGTWPEKEDEEGRGQDLTYST